MIPGLAADGRDGVDVLLQDPIPVPLGGKGLLASLLDGEDACDADPGGGGARGLVD